MAKNMVINAQTFRTLTAGGSISSGDPVWDTSALVLYVALADATIGQAYAVAADGVWTLPATALEAWSVGEPLYWNPVTSKLTNIAGALTRVGTVYAAKSNGASYTTGQCDLGVRT